MTIIFLNYFLLKKKKNDAFMFKEKIRKKIDALRIEKIVYDKFNEVCDKQFISQSSKLVVSKLENEETK